MRKHYDCQCTNRNERKFKDTSRDCDCPKTRLKKKSSCLSCGKKISSKGLYNRICGECNLINERMLSSMYSVSGIFSEGPELLENLFFELN